MPRAKRYFDAGLIWHITHRCHKKEFLFKFAKDRRNYISWLYKAKKRYGLRVLNYMVTSNHIHLLVIDSEKRFRNTIPRSMQLTAGRTAQEYNQRKNRNGAFWEDRYHVTLIDNDDHLNQCMTYIDMNMVRAGVASHPKEWAHCGFHEIFHSKKCLLILDVQMLLAIFAQNSLSNLFEFRHSSVDDAILKNMYLIKDKKWTESVAVGRQSFLNRIKEQNLGKTRGRRIRPEENSYILKERQAPYFSNRPIKKLPKR